MKLNRTFLTLIFDDILTHDLISFSSKHSPMTQKKREVFQFQTHSSSRSNESAKIASLQLECAHEEIFFSWASGKWHSYRIDTIIIGFFRLPFLYVTRDIIPIEVCATRPKKREEKQKRIKRKFSSGEAAARRDEEKSAKWREKSF